MVQESINWLNGATLEGEIWHEKSALSCAMLGFRGFARWHTIEAEGDAKTRRDINKYAADNLHIVPTPDLSSLSRAAGYAITEHSQIHKHLSSWISRESGYIESLKEHISKLSAGKHYTVYGMLCDYLAELENELMYVHILAENLSYGETTHHFIQVSKKIHEWFEREYDGGRIDFAIC